MNAENVFRLIGILLACWFILIVAAPLWKKLRKKIKVQQRIRELEGLGFDMTNVVTDPCLSRKELDLYADNPEPTEADILKYYKMYCKKWEIKCENEWTTREPMSFDEWEKNAKAETKVSGNPKTQKYLFVMPGKYQFMIPQTCDVMIGFPPNHTYHRYTDYAKLVEEDDKKLMETIENEEV